VRWDDLVRADGSSLYGVTSVVDDIAFGITHAGTAT
jgi:hypothetical protein